MSTIGARLKTIRLELGLTQTQLAHKVGIRPQHINGIERGLKKPSEQLLKSISRELGICEDWLRAGKKPVFISLHEEIIKIIARYGRRALLDYCLKLAIEEEDVYYQSQLKESLDKENFSLPHRMAKYLIETYTQADQKTKHWMEIQFERAFPEYRETLKKKDYYQVKE